MSKGIMEERKGKRVVVMEGRNGDRRREGRERRRESLLQGKKNIQLKSCLSRAALKNIKRKAFPEMFLSRFRAEDSKVGERGSEGVRECGQGGRGNLSGEGGRRRKSGVEKDNGRQREEDM